MPIRENVGTIPQALGVVAHARAVITDTPGTLASFISGGIPTASILDGPKTIKLTPYAVELAIEKASVGNTVYWVLDDSAVSNSPLTVSATLGMTLPVLSTTLFLNVSDFTKLKLVASVNPTNVQCLFYYGR